MIHISHYSGGIGSWAATKRVAEKHGTENLHLIFADTIIEDNDLYRFLIESVSEIFGSKISGGKALELPEVHVDLPARKVALALLRQETVAAFPNLHWIADGRTPWEVFKDERYVGNSRKDPCSKILKRKFIDAFCKEKFNRADCTHYFGIDWTEEHRIERVRKRLPNLICEAPLCERPMRTKEEFIGEASKAGIRPPRLYGLGAKHNNCGLWCVKSGQAQFALLLKRNPTLYAYHEGKEQEMMVYLGRKDCTVMKCRRGIGKDGKPKPLSMKDFRLRLEQNPEEYDKFEWGGCGCAL